MLDQISLPVLGENVHFTWTARTLYVRISISLCCDGHSDHITLLTYKTLKQVFCSKYVHAILRESPSLPRIWGERLQNPCRNTQETSQRIIFVIICCHVGLSLCTHMWLCRRKTSVAEDAR